MDKDFIIWLLTVICISWLIMVTVYMFRLKREFDDLYAHWLFENRYAGNIRRDVTFLSERVRRLEKGEKFDDLKEKQAYIERLRARAECDKASEKFDAAEMDQYLIDDFNGYIERMYGQAYRR